MNRVKLTLKVGHTCKSGWSFRTRALNNEGAEVPRLTEWIVM
jgi:hypothetical protein